MRQQAPQHVRAPPRRASPARAHAIDRTRHDVAAQLLSSALPNSPKRLGVPISVHDGTSVRVDVNRRASASASDASRLLHPPPSAPLGAARSDRAPAAIRDVRPADARASATGCKRNAPSIAKYSNTRSVGSSLTSRPPTGATTPASAHGRSRRASRKATSGSGVARVARHRRPAARHRAHALAELLRPKSPSERRGGAEPPRSSPMFLVSGRRRRAPARCRRPISTLRAQLDEWKAPRRSRGVGIATARSSPTACKRRA